MIAVIDYHKGNLMSVERGLEGVGAHAFITDDASEIARADAIVLPGVGAFADAMESMRALGQDVVVKDRVACGVPFLGICLGLHLMFSEGEEGAGDAGTVAGLGLIDGVVRAMPRQDTSGSKYKVPHVGWNSIHPASSIRQDVELGAHAEGEGFAGVPDSAVETATDLTAGSFECPLFAGIPDGEFFYFTHSFIAPTTPEVVTMTTHSVTFASAVQLGERAFGVQFHPEKSSDAGARVLRNFVELAGEAL